MYEDYMQNLFNTYDYDMCYGYEPFMPYNYMSNMPRSTRATTQNLEDLYPEIYKIVYPMVKKICGQTNRPVDEELIEEMTQDIYSNLEAGNIINVNINVDNDNTVSSINRTESQKDNRSISRSPSSVSNRVSESSVIERSQENRSNESRQSRNPILRDLIRILLLREFSDRPGNRPPFPDYRPPRPGPRPPFPGPMPPFPGQRPPMPPTPPRPGNLR